MILIGFHAIEALLRSGQKVRAVQALVRSQNPRVETLRKLAQEKKVTWREYAAKEQARFEAELKRAGGTGQDLETCQGVFAEFDEVKTIPHLELLRSAREKEKFPLLIYLDSITDPQNLGSILRSAAFFGAAGIVLTESRSSPITPAALKVSSGGFVFVPIAKVPNLARALDEAKEEGFWIVGLSEHASEKIQKAHFDSPLGLVIGNEEKGIRQLTEKTCDFTLALPGNGELISLNAAVAAAVAMSTVRAAQKQ